MIQPKSKTLISIVGPTAVGKTAFSISIAKKLKAEIISSDSRQFFQEMSIGTARPSKAEMGKIKHHFIGHLSVKDEINAGLFEEQALALIERIHITQDIALLVGGSGLYQRAITHGLDNPPSNENTRKQLIEELNTKGIESLQAELKERDLLSYNKVDIKNPQRLLRALEACRVSGKPYSFYLNEEQKIRPFKIISIGLKLSREDLYLRINQRVDQMIENGLIEEARGLYPYKNLNALNTVGYKELFEVFDGLTTEKEAIEKIKKNTRNFAKRQLTWFKKYSNARWFVPDEFSEALAYIQEELEN